MSEHIEQTRLFQILELYEGKYPILRWVFAIPNGGHRIKSVAVKMKSEGVRAGVWDIFVPVAVEGFSGLFIEMKFGKNKLTSKQKKFMDMVGGAYQFSVCYDGIKAARVIGDYLDICELRSLE